MAIEISRIKDGKRVRYSARTHEGAGKVIETYRAANNSWWVRVQNKATGSVVTVRPSQLYAA
jgi:hypothetical protein